MDFRKKVNETFLNISKSLQRGLNNNDNTRAVFVVGNQRSGTTMLLEHLNKHIDIDVFQEGSNVMKDFILKSNEDINKILSRSRASVAILKPLEDSHRITELLNDFKDSKAIWMFRNYNDVINSSLKKGWGKHLKEYVIKINDDIYFKYSEPLNLTIENVELVKKLYHENISEENCAAIIWYLRNTIYFDQILGKEDRALLVNYEKLVKDAEIEMKKILNFFELKHVNLHHGVHKMSIRKDMQKELDPQIQKICNEIYLKLLNELNA